MSTIVIVAGTVAATVAAYAFQLLGGRALGPESFAPVTILWTVQFLVMQILYQPLEHYGIRELELGRRPDPKVVAGIVLGGATVVERARGNGFPLRAAMEPE
jgi:O-antigen/teichoic acid export membrane protein